MEPTRITISGLMGLVCLVAIGTAALRYPTQLGDSAIFSLILLLFSVATLGAVQFLGRVRARWLGFALFGWIYVAVACGPGADENRPRLLTTLALKGWDRKPDPESRDFVSYTIPVTTGARPSLSFTSGSQSFQSEKITIFTTSSQSSMSVNVAYLIPIAHSLSAIGFAIVGGAIGGVLFGMASRVEARKESRARAEDRPLSG